MAMQHKEYPLIEFSSIQNLFIQIMEKDDRELSGIVIINHNKNNREFF